MQFLTGSASYHRLTHIETVNLTLLFSFLLVFFHLFLTVASLCVLGLVLTCVFVYLCFIYICAFLFLFIFYLEFCCQHQHRLLGNTHHQNDLLCNTAYSVTVTS